MYICLLLPQTPRRLRKAAVRLPERDWPQRSTSAEGGEAFPIERAIETCRATAVRFEEFALQGSMMDVQDRSHRIAALPRHCDR